MLWQFFLSLVSKMVSNIDIFQGIVSKLEIPVSWQHYLASLQSSAWMK